MKTEITLITDNPHKICQAQAARELFDITINPAELIIDEIQHHNPMRISINKADQAFDFIKQPVVINDTSWDIPALQGFPGGYMHDVAEWLTSCRFYSTVTR